MASITFHKDGDREYQVDLSFNEELILPEIEIRGKTRINGGEWSEVFFTVRLNIDSETVEVLLQDKVIGELQINSTDYDFDRDLRDKEFEENSDFYWSDLKLLFDDDGQGIDSAVEHIISSIPAGDPLLGCLIKAGISTSVGEIIRCYHNHKEIGNKRQTVKNVINCLGRRWKTILGKFGWRSIRCMVSGGFS